MFQPEPPASSRRPRRLRLLLLLLLLVGAGLLAAHYAGWLPGSAQNLSPAERDDALIARAEQLLARTDPPPQELYSMAVELYSDCHDHRRADPCVLRLVAEAARRGLPKNASLLNKAGNLKGRLMIIYGGNDPVCVPQQTLSFIRACIDAGTHPDLFTYPGDEHNMMGTDRIHLHEHISRYFDDYLK